MKRVVPLPKLGAIQFIATRASYGWFVRVAYVNQKTLSESKR